MVLHSHFTDEETTKDKEVEYKTQHLIWSTWRSLSNLSLKYTVLTIR